MDIKGKVLLQLFNKSYLRNGTKTFLEPKFFSIVKFKKFGFSALLILEFYAVCTLQTHTCTALLTPSCISFDIDI